MKKWIVFITLAGLVSAACARMEETSALEEVPAVKYHTVTLSAVAPENLTKTAYADEQTFSWSDGDQISVLFNNGSTSKFFPFTAVSGGSNTAVFVGSVEDGYDYEGAASSGDKWALYPADAGHKYADGKVTFHLPLVVDQSTHESANIPMAARHDGGAYVFTHIAGAYKFTFTGLDATKVRLEVRNMSKHNISGDFPISVASASNMYWYAQATGDKSPDNTLSIIKNVSAGTATFYVPCGSKDESIFQPVIVLKDEITGKMLHISTAKNMFSADKLLPSSSRMVVMPSVAASGTGKNLLSKWGINWESVTESAPAYHGIAMKATAPDEDYLYLYFEVDKSGSEMLLDEDKGYANKLELYLGNEESTNDSWLWTVAPKLFHDGPISTAWITYNGKASFYNYAPKLILDYNYNDTAEKCYYEMKISRAAGGDYSYLNGAHTGRVGCILYYNKYRDGGTSEYHGSPQNSLLTVTLPGTGSSPSPAPSADADLLAAYDARVAYTESNDMVMNPERGIFKYLNEHFTSGSSEISLAQVEAAHAQGYSLLYLAFYLTGFETSDISAAYLTKIQNSLAAFRGTGVKCILRFAYSNGHSDGDRPFDASEAQIESHIAQLKPILQEYRDVIFVMQAGFIGSWGEWYYTESFGGGGDYRYYHGGDAAAHDIDYVNRKKVADKLLEAMADGGGVVGDRQVALRTPSFKINMYGSTALDAEHAHDGSDAARLGGFNDCFRASSSDSGTFSGETDRNFWKADSKYTLMGGETCSLSSYCDWSGTLADLQDYHWTYLNTSYNSDVLNYWKRGGHYNEIVNRLGYRLVLMDTYYTVSGSTMSVAIRINNKGFAAPMNPRGAKLIWKPTEGAEQVFDLATNADPRGWHSGITTVTATLAGLTSTSGTLYLYLPDPLCNKDHAVYGTYYTTTTPKYAIACANPDVFQAATGYNKLLEL